MSGLCNTTISNLSVFLGLLLCFIFAHLLFVEMTDPLLYSPNEPQIVKMAGKGLLMDTVVLSITSYIVDH